MEKKMSKTGLFGKKTNGLKSKKSKLDSNFYDNVNDFLVVDGVLKKYNGSETVVTIPNDLGIDSIGQRAFYKRTDVRTIIIPMGITSIANYAFSCCENLASITIPETITYIGNYAFENCTSLTKVDLPGRLQSVGSYLFSGCTHLVDITLPYELKTIGNYMFFKCESLPKIQIPEKVTSIGWKAFSGCVSLSEIEFPKLLDSIGNYAFENCSKLTNIHFSDNITSIGEGIFFMCKGLSSITIDETNAAYKMIDGCMFNYDGTVLYTYPSKLSSDTSYTVPDGVKTICYGAFSSCISLHEIILPNSVEVIDNCAFFNCLNLKNINLTSNIRAIGKNAFNNCYNLSEITLPEIIDTIETGTFSGCSNLEKINVSDNLKSYGEIAFFGCVKLQNFRFPKELTTIGCAAFTNCQSLTEVNIHNNITTIAKGAFSHCKNLSTINVSSENNNYSAKDGVLYNKDGTCLLVYPSGKQDECFVIPSEVTHINDQAFYGSIHLKEITIPSSVEDLGLSAFSECPILNKVTIENGIENIGTFVFSKNPNLSIVSIPKTVTSIDPSAFLECENLTFVCEKDSFAYKFATIKNIPLFSDKVSTNDTSLLPKKGLFKRANTTEEPIKEVKEQEEKNIPDITFDEPLDISSTTTETENDISETINEEPIDEVINDSPVDDSITTDTLEDTFDNIDNNEYTDNKDVSSVLTEEIPVVNTKPFATLNSLVMKEVEYMNDVSNLFNNIPESNNIDGLNVSSDEYYNNEQFALHPDFDPNLIFNGNPFDPFMGETVDDLENPNTVIGIQEEYSSPNKIKNVAVKQNSTSSVILTWDEYPETSEYHLLHFNTKTKSYDDVCKLKTNKALLTGIIPSHVQQYKIISYQITKGQKTLIASSNAISVSTILPPVTGLEVISSTDNSITFSWRPISDAINYIVYAYNQLKKCFVPVDETTDNYITFSNLEGVTSLKIKVAGISKINNVECVTSLSEEIIGYTTIPVVNNIIVSSFTNTSIKLVWNSLPNIDIYKVYAFNDKTNRFEFVDSTPINQIVFNHLVPNKEYKFKIRAVTYMDDTELMGAPSDIITANTAS